MNGVVLLAPGFLLLALLLPLALWLRRRSRPPAIPFPGLALAERLPGTWRTRLGFLPVALQILGLLLVILALARPAVREELPLTSEGLDIILCLDVSSSMQAKDMDPERTRLDVARQGAVTFVEGRPDDSIGLVTFARFPDLLSPPTRDHEALKTILAGVETVESDSLEDATGIGTAVARATQVLAESGAPSGVVILLTDGEENVALLGAEGEIAPVEAGQFSERLGVRVYAIAAGVKIDTRPLRDLARRTGGTFHQVGDANALEAVYARIDQLEKAPLEEGRTIVRDVYRSFLLAALALLLVACLLAAVVFHFRYEKRRGVVLCGLGLLLGGFALLGPSFGDAVDDAAWGGVDIVVALDVSQSMLAEDMDPSRLGRAQADIQSLAERARGDRLGLVVFAGDARLLVPLTRDRVAFAAAARAADPTSVKRGGTNLGSAVEVGLAALAVAEQAGAQLILLTDGEDMGGRALLAAARARVDGVTLHAVGYGSRRGSKIAVALERGEAFLRDDAGRDVVSALDVRGLQDVANSGAGVLVIANDQPDALASLYDERILPKAKMVQGEAHGRPADHFQVPLLLAFLLWLLALARPRAVGLPAAVVLLAALCTGGCEASSESLYAESVSALESEDFGEAERLARALEERGDEAFLGPAAFVRGNAQFARSVRAEAASKEHPQDPRARLETVAHAENALAAWQVAALSRPDWPEARRNVERGLRRLDALRESGGSSRPPPPRPPPPPPPPSPGADEETQEETPPTIITRELAPEHVLDLFERLSEKEREKRRLRQTERRARGKDVEKDW